MITIIIVIGAVVVAAFAVGLITAESDAALIDEEERLRVEGHPYRS